MIERSIRYGFLALITALLMSCGGSGGSSDDDGGDGDPGNGDGGGPTSFTVAALSSSPQLQSDADQASEGVSVTGLVRDQNNNVVAGQEVSFASTSGALQDIDATTDANGTASATLTTAGNPQNRIITVTVTAGSQSDTIDIQVTGTQLSVSGPDSIVFGQSATYTVTLVDAGGTGINDEVVQVTSQQGNAVSMTNTRTNTSGRVEFTLDGNVAGTDTITVESLGLTATKQVVISEDNFRYQTPSAGDEIPLSTNETVTIEWQRSGSNITDGTPIDLSTTRGTFGNGQSSIEITTSGGNASTTISATTAGPAQITATGRPSSGDEPTAQLKIEFIATTPSDLSAQADPSTIGPESNSQIRAVVRDSNNNPVKNQTVIFSIDNDPSGGTLDASQATTDSQGVASVTFTAGNTTTGIDEVVIDAQVDGTAISDQATLTVAKRALDVVIGTGNELLVPNNTQFQLPYTVAVTDSAGNPVSDAEVQLSITSLRYFKGEFSLVDVDGDGNADAWSPFPYDGECNSEDVNGNGSLDSGEDSNLDGELTPGNVATVPASVTVNDEGFGNFNVTYPQDQNLWVEVRLRAAASSQGSEGDAERVFTVPALAEDVNDTTQEPPGVTSPYGTGACP